MNKTKREKRLARLREYYYNVQKAKVQAVNVYKPEMMKRPYVGLTETSQ